MRVFAGIDEAGYGPLLGPLVVSLVAFGIEGDGEEADEPPCLWALLKGAVRRTLPRKGGAAAAEARRSERSRTRPVATGGARGGPRPPRSGDWASGPLTICDSKKLYQGGKGLRAMEEAVLAFLRLVRADSPACGTLHALLEAQGVPRADLEPYPWFHGRDIGLPRHTFASVVERRTAALARTCAARAVRPIALRIVPVHAREFNGGVESSGNKHNLEAGIVRGFLGDLFRDHGAAGVDVTCDKLGGRDFYGDVLAPLVPGGAVEALAEGNDRSVYALRDRAGTRRLTVRFLKDGESCALPVALASLASKYVRELFMECLNAFFVERLPRLKPTAGYYGDGQRFIEAVLPEVRRLRLDPALLVRCC
jgi:hypothetical protein